MCEPVSQIMFASQTLGSIYQYGQQKNAVRARNRAKLQNFNVENEQYIADNILRNVDWKNSVLNSEINIDNLFKQASQVWQAQDLAIQGAYDKHAFNNVDILIKMYESEGAREQTGVTAQRISNESIRKAGFALTKSWQDLIFAKDQAQLQKETTRIEANQKRRDAWQQIRQAPVPGATPIAPQLEADPSMGGMLLNIAMSAATSWLMGSQLKELRDMKDALGKGKDQFLKLKELQTSFNVTNLNLGSYATAVKSQLPSVYSGATTAASGGLSNLGGWSTLTQINPARFSLNIPQYRATYPSFYSGSYP